MNQPDPAQDGQQMAVTRCEHAVVVVGDGTLPNVRGDIPDAEPVVFGKNGEGVEGVANRAAKLLHLSQSGLSEVLRVAGLAADHGMPLLMRLGETQHYVVYHDGERSIDASWAAVECDVALAGGAGAARTRGRATARKSFRCKVRGTSKLECTKYVAIFVPSREYSSVLFMFIWWDVEVSLPAMPGLIALMTNGGQQKHLVQLVKLALSTLEMKLFNICRVRMELPNVRGGINKLDHFSFQPVWSRCPLVG